MKCSFRWMPLRLAAVQASLVALCLPSQAALQLQQTWKAAPVLLQHVEFSPDGNAVLTASGGGVAQLWSLDGTAGPQFQGQRPPMFNAHFSADGREIITTGYDGTAWVWTVAGQKLRSYPLHRAAVAEARFYPASAAAAAGLISSSDDGQVVVRDGNGQPLWSGLYPGTARQFSLSPDGQFIVASSDSGQLHVIRPSANRRQARVQSIQTPHGRINQLAFSPDSTLLVAAGTDGKVTLWTTGGQPLLSLTASSRGWSRGAVFCSAGANAVLTIGDDGTLRSWSRSGRLMESLVLSTSSALTSLDCSADGRRAVVSGSQGEVWLLNLTNPASPSRT